MQTETATNRFLDSFPPSFIVGSCILGLIMLFLTPLKFLFDFPDWLRNPLLANSSSEILGRFGVIILLAFPFGIPLSFLDIFFVRTSGFNDTLHIFLRLVWQRKFRKILAGMIRRVKEFFMPIEPKGSKFFESQLFVTWLRGKIYWQDFYYSVIANTVVSDFLVGCEIAVIINLLWLFVWAFSSFNKSISPIQTLLASAMLLIIVWFYNKKYWNRQLERIKAGYEYIFEKETKESQLAC